MTVTIDRVAPVAHLPLVLGVLRKLDLAEFIHSMSPVARIYHPYPNERFGVRT